MLPTRFCTRSDLSRSANTRQIFTHTRGLHSPINNLLDLNYQPLELDWKVKRFSTRCLEAQDPRQHCCVQRRMTPRHYLTFETETEYNETYDSAPAR